MASILDRYGIKEVADITFYTIKDNGEPDYPVLYVDTAKVSTIEQTAEETTANGGKGNPPLISWDFGKDITVTLEDALFSAKSMAIMFAKDQNSIDFNTLNGSGDDTYIMKTEQYDCETDGTTATFKYNPYFYFGDKKYEKVNAKIYSARGKFLANAPTDATVETTVTVSVSDEDTELFVSYDLKVTGTIINISGDSFPGTYYVTGDTYARSEASGMDEFFQFILPKAKVTSENTITLEAEGDPSVFNMNLHVLRAKDGSMMKLVKYDLDGGTEGGNSTDYKYYHAADLTAE